MVKRQGYFGKFENANGKYLVMIYTDVEGRKKNCTNMIVNPDSNTKVIYYDCTIRLKDLPFFQNLPPIRSGTLRINLTLNNNVSFNFTKTGFALASTGPPVHRKGRKAIPSQSSPWHEEEASGCHHQNEA
jgi:hypothetical protein